MMNGDVFPRSASEDFIYSGANLINKNPATVSRAALDGIERYHLIYSDYGTAVSFFTLYHGSVIASMVIKIRPHLMHLPGFWQLGYPSQLNNHQCAERLSASFLQKNNTFKINEIRLLQFFIPRCNFSLTQCLYLKSENYRLRQENKHGLHI